MIKLSSIVGLIIIIVVLSIVLIGFIGTFYPQLIFSQSEIESIGRVLTYITQNYM